MQIISQRHSLDGGSGGEEAGTNNVDGSTDRIPAMASVPSDAIFLIENIGLNTTPDAIQQLIPDFPIATGETATSYDLARAYAAFIPRVKRRSDTGSVVSSDASSMNNNNINNNNNNNILQDVSEEEIPTTVIPFVVFKCDVFRGKGFVQLQNPSDIVAAVNALNNRIYKNRVLKVRVSSRAERFRWLVDYAICIERGENIVRLKGLDFCITSERIRDFLLRALLPEEVRDVGIEIPRFSCGTASGDAFVSAQCVEYVRKILKLHLQWEGVRQVEVMEANVDDMQRVGQSVAMRQTLPWQARRASARRANNTGNSINDNNNNNNNNNNAVGKASNKCGGAAKNSGGRNYAARPPTQHLVEMQIQKQQQQQQLIYATAPMQPMLLDGQRVAGAMPTASLSAPEVQQQLNTPTMQGGSLSPLQLSFSSGAQQYYTIPQHAQPMVMQQQPQALFTDGTSAALHVTAAPPQPQPQAIVHINGTTAVSSTAGAYPPQVMHPLMAVPQPPQQQQHVMATKMPKQQQQQQQPPIYIQQQQPFMFQQQQQQQPGIAMAPPAFIASPQQQQHQQQQQQLCYYYIC